MENTLDPVRIRALLQILHVEDQGYAQDLIFHTLGVGGGVEGLRDVPDQKFIETFSSVGGSWGPAFLTPAEAQALLQLTYSQNPSGYEVLVYFKSVQRRWLKERASLDAQLAPPPSREDAFGDITKSLNDLYAIRLQANNNLTVNNMDAITRLFCTLYSRFHDVRIEMSHTGKGESDFGNDLDLQRDLLSYYDAINILKARTFDDAALNALEKMMETLDAIYARLGPVMM